MIHMAPNTAPRCNYTDEITLSVDSLADYLAAHFADMKGEILGGARSDDHEFWWHRMARHAAKYGTDQSVLLPAVIVRATEIVRSSIPA